ncbi:unnamed protein product, partial [Leptidea sinapis]
MVPVSVYDSRVIEYQLSRSFPLNIPKREEFHPEVNYDVLLTAAGGFGKYQWYLFFISGPFYFFFAFVYFSQIFITQVSTNHWCWIPELENLTVTERRNIAIPKDQSSSFGYSRCSSYVADWKDVLNTGQRPNETWSTQECQYGWEFDKTEIPYQTISSELGWVCEKNSYQAIAQSIYFIGSVFGSLLFGWISDKSPRWLLSMNRVDEAIDKVNNIAKINGETIPENMIQLFKTNVGAGTKEDESSCLEIFKRPLMLKMFLSMCLLYSCNVISYDVLLRNIESLGYDFFLSFTLISITELPACILVGFVLDRLGRKFMMVVSLGICIICCITIILLSGGLAAVAFAMIARFTLNISYNISMQWPNEIVPTCVRGSATSIIHICGVFAAVLSPYIAYSENYVTGMPLILIAIISATGILCCFVIPETSGKDLPQTFSEAEELVFKLIAMSVCMILSRDIQRELISEESEFSGEEYND